MNIFSTLALFVIIATQAIAQQNDVLTRNNSIEKKIGIEEMEASKNNIDLRIFLGTGISNGGHVVQIVQRNGRWKGIKFDYLLEIKDRRLTEKVKEVKRTKLKSANWDSLWMKLEQLNVLSLPSQSEIQDKLRKKVDTSRGEAYEILFVSDGSGYDLVVKKEGHLAGYSFHNPWDYAEAFPDVEEVKNYSAIVATLEKEFGIAFR